MPTPTKLNVHEAFDLIEAPWAPAIAAQVGGSMVKLVRLEGSFVWHHHEAEDELFYVLSGRLRMQFREQEVVLEAGELICVPAGVEHCPVGEDDCRVMLVEPASTVNTGSVESARTVRELVDLR
ncbi:MAG: cupin domain-containing protein [Myxococcota bacterium]|nr:cupin domain-containing protein [Myxococcota bacterium]